MAVVDAWLTLLHAARGSAHRKWLDALEAAGSAQALVAESARALAARGIDADEIARLHTPDETLLAGWRAWLDANPSRALIPFGSERYPTLLAHIDDAPLALWVEGARPELLDVPQLAMVGSRSPTGGGRDTAEQFAKYLSERGLTITSGLATGIDGASHRGALQGVASTVAVLGGGIDVLFPREHRKLADDVAANGVLVSEYPPGLEPRPRHFPARNRIIAGLSLGTLVVEATRRSGSLITAKLALDYGREVFAVPGSIHNPLARGCHYLIRQGAKLVEEAADIFVELKPLLPADVIAASKRVSTNVGDANARSRMDDPEYNNVVENLDFSPLPIAIIAQRTGLTAAELSSMLLVLELDGFVEALPGGRYSRLKKE